MAWNNCITLVSFADRGLVAGVDTDGDVGFLDHEGYSVGIRREEVPKLILWLQHQLREYEPAGLILHHPEHGECRHLPEVDSGAWCEPLNNPGGQVPTEACTALPAKVLVDRRFVEHAQRLMNGL